MITVTALVHISDRTIHKLLTVDARFQNRAWTA